MRNKNIYINAIMALGLASCSVEAPFKGFEESGNGEFHKSSLSLDVKADNNVKVRAANDEDLLNEFTITFTNASGAKYKEFAYKEMPEVISLPAGSYKVSAIYGEDLDAAWDNPHYKGESVEFDVKPDKIVSELDPITCTLQNVMVSVIFDPELLGHMEEEPDPEVEVYVNQEKPLVFKKEHSDNLKPGYFKHSEVCTLTAKFTGTVDGVKLTEIKTLDNIEAGNHYRLTFKRHSFNGEDHGDSDLNLQVDASVTVNEVGTDYEVGEDEVMTDVTFPGENNGNNDQKPGDNNGDDNNGEEPGDDNNGDNNTGEDQPGGDQPSIPDGPGIEEPVPSNGPEMALDPASTVKLGANEYNEISANTKVILNIHSDAGIDEFKAEIISATLDLTQVGGSSNTLDLVNPDEATLSLLQGLNIFESSQTTVKGYHDVVFDISEFMTLLMALQDGDHQFVINVKDAGGAQSVVLNLNYHPNK